MAVMILCSASAAAISKRPVVSMLAAMMGTPDHDCLLFLNLKVRTRSTSDRDLMVDRFGRISTSLKSSLMSFSMRIFLCCQLILDK
jgi:hypothetical protein